MASLIHESSLFGHSKFAFAGTEYVCSFSPSSFFFGVKSDELHHDNQTKTRNNHGQNPEAVESSYAEMRKVR